MKKLYILLLSTIFYLSQAQEIKEILLSQNGKKAIVNINLKGTSISIDTSGNLLHMNLMTDTHAFLNQSASATFQNDVEFTYRDPNSVVSSDSAFEYYDDFYKYSGGKLKSVNGILIKYFDDFYSYRVGKISSVGDVKFDYYDDFYSYQKGKIKSIGSINFTYFDDFYKYRSGKLESIKGNNDKIKVTIFNE